MGLEVSWSSRDLTRGPGSFKRRGRRSWRQILVEFAGLGRRPSPRPKAEDANHTHLTVKGKGEHVTGPDRAGGLVCGLAVYPQLPLGHQDRCEAAGLEEARMPEPLVEPDGRTKTVRGFALLGLNRAGAAAQGL